jgi:hypothetical protein
MAAALTLAEAATVLNPPLTEQQLRRIITALGWQPEDWRRTGRPGHPAPCYNATRLMQLHAALVPFNDGIAYGNGQATALPGTPPGGP